MPTQSKERPIIFSSGMIRAILDGRKSQTRRVIKPQPQAATDRLWRYTDRVVGSAACHGTRAEMSKVLRRDCPYGIPGDRLWVRESWARVYEKSPIIVSRRGRFVHTTRRQPLRADHLYRDCRLGDKYQSVIVYGADGPMILSNDKPVKWKPSIHMKRAFARLILEVKSVRVERVQDITIGDAVAEGIELGPTSLDGSKKLSSRYAPPHLLEDWIALWDSINAGRGYGWTANPWLRVVEFTKEQP